ncbi:MAG: twin-arginine translocation signal domain-containing protein, partial [candidate division WOR-3 bacterium]
MKKISRRNFLKISAVAIANLALPVKIFASDGKNSVRPMIGVARGNKGKLVEAAVNAIGGIEK